MSDAEHDPGSRTARSRTLRRQARLAALTEPTGNGQSVDDRARAARETLWRRRPQLSHIQIRPELIAHGDERPNKLRAVSTPRGAAVQVLLLALFEAQTRRRTTSATRPTTLPLRAATREHPAWLHLAALPTEDQSHQRSHVRLPDDNRYGQLRAALDRLHRAGRISAGTGRGRFERFALLDEAADNLSREVAYTWPRPKEPVIRVPVEFFINGWVHALEDNEIITLLYLLHVCDHAKAAGDPNGWVPIPTSCWRWAFGPDRGYQAHRDLTRFGLVEVERPQDRRADGTVAADDTVPWEAHRYRVREEVLAVAALQRVRDALQTKHALDIDEAAAVRDGPYIVGAPAHVTPEGWTFSAARAALEQEGLAAPTPPPHILRT